jgi:hypothetical protein
MRAALLIKSVLGKPIPSSFSEDLTVARIENFSKIVEPKGIAFSLQDYLELVDDTGRTLRHDKRGVISALNVSSAKLLTRLNIPQDNWLKPTTEFGMYFMVQWARCKNSAVIVNT